MRWMMVMVFIAVLSGCSGKPDLYKSIEPIPGVHPVVTIEMEDGGKIEVALFPEVAPNTVNNFISLVSKGFYEGVIFHRVIPDFMIQGGDPTGTGNGDPGYYIRGEFPANGVENFLRHERGVISMARGGENNTAGSQFFIMVGQSASHLDGKYAAFGKVISSMETVDAIVNVPRNESRTGLDRPYDPPKIKKATVETYGKTYEEPEIIPRK
jgi:peptidyl-prolyl cis-trans isomerase B (cyclophilin B)